MFNMNLKHLENSESTAWNAIRIKINEKFLNQNSKATLVTRKIGPKIGIKINFALKSDLIQFSGLFRQKLLSRHCTVPRQKFLSQHFSFHKFNHHS